MRKLSFLAALLIVASVSLASAGTEPFNAGISRITVSGNTPFDVLVWYPTDSEGAAWEMESWPIPASQDAPIARGSFPIVLLSHGGGVTGGKPLVLGQLSADLARRGFVVIAPFHGTTGLLGRPSQVRMALDAVLADSRFRPHVDPARLGMLGFSLGTAVTLELAGGIPDFNHLDSYCDNHPDDVMSCDHAPGEGSRKKTAVPWWAFWVRRAPSTAPLPLKALVLLDPFGVLFPRDHLTAVTMPVLIFRPDASELPGEENAIGLATALPRHPRYETVLGGHFIFVDVCPPARKAASPQICLDPPSVDRASVHTAVEAQIAAFFSDNL